jgi:DNA mismatch endonuclease (patch repair protein)
MVDRISPQGRSALMAKIRRANTKPELAVRRILTKLGYRYRIHLAGIPGRPDVAFTARRKAVFIHGCFWHAHDNCHVFKLPKTRRDFWSNKFAKNKARDARLSKAARAAGWKVIVIWECDLVTPNKVSRRLVRFLGPPKLDQTPPSA